MISISPFLDGFCLNAGTIDVQELTLKKKTSKQFGPVYMTDRLVQLEFIRPTTTSFLPLGSSLVESAIIPSAPYFEIHVRKNVLGSAGGGAGCCMDYNPAHRKIWLFEVCLEISGVRLVMIHGLNEQRVFTIGIVPGKESSLCIPSGVQPLFSPPSSHSKE